MKTIDARGLSCPEPVVLTRKALSGGDSACQIIVDSPTACENVARYAKDQGYRVEIEEKNGEFTLSARK